MTIPVYTANLKNNLERGTLQVDLELWKKLEPDETIQRIIWFSRWSAFFRTVTWDGLDSEIHKDEILVARVPELATVSLAADRIQRDQVIFKKYLGDFGRDLNKDNFFEDLVITMQVDSIYEGELFTEAEIEGVIGPFFGACPVTRGIVEVNLVLDGSKIRQAKKNGPYKIRNISVMNNSLFCPGGQCNPKNQPPFTVHLGDYVTTQYQSSQFK